MECCKFATPGKSLRWLCVLMLERFFTSDLIMPWIRQHQIDSFFQTLRVLCSRVEYAEKPIDELFKISEAFNDVKIFEILDWFAFTGVQITTLPPDFYLGSALSVLVRSWNTPMSNENLKIHRALVRKLVTAGADLHYRDSHQRTLLQRLVAYSPVQITHENYINEWLSLLEDCNIDLRDYLLQMSHFSDFDPFEIVTYSTIRAVKKTAVSIFIYEEMYTCMDLCIIGLRFDNLGHPIPEILRWVDPESPAALVLEEFSFCANLLIIPGEYCNRLGDWIPSWERNLQDLRDVPIDASRMLTSLGWKFEISQAGRSILPPGQVNAWLLDDGIFGPLAIFVQNLAMKPEIAISRCPAWAQQEWDEVLESAAQMEESTKTTVKNDYASLKAMELCRQGNCQYFTFCDCDASGIYLDLWPFHGSTHTLCQTGNKLHQVCLGSAGPYAFGERWCEIHRCRFNHARFERKQAKKFARGRKREAVEFPMPGAWPS